MGIVVQSVKDKPYSQVHTWLGNHYNIKEEDILGIAGTNDLFTVVRTIVYQIK